MIMEYVEGVTLASRLQHGAVPVAEGVNYVDQVLDALIYAHQMGVVHRDIKPGNMMLTPQGVVKLMDFGLARPGNESGMTMTGTTLGSLNYMSPEQVKGETADARSDLYSLGISLYEIVTGRLPFRGESSYSLMVAQLQQAPEPPIVVRPDLPKGLNDVILMALAKEPEKRFQSALAFRNALKSVSGYPSDSHAPAVLPAPTPAVATRAATAPVPQQAQPAMAAAAPSPATQKSHRGLYMALGAVLVVAILAGAAVYVPHRAKTQASAGPAASSSATSPAPADTAPPAANPPASAASATDAASTGTDAAAGKDQTAAAQAAAQAAAAKAAADAAAKAAAAQAEAEAQAKAAELAEAEKQADQLSSRAAAVSQSLDNLKRQQAAQGYGLRGDIVAAEQRMQINMARAEAALQKQDAAKAKEYMDLAEMEVETIERFLGR